MISAKNIHKSYGDVHVLKGITLGIDQGEIVSIIGKSGAGKSTLLHILGTLDVLDNGHLMINNISINDLSEKEMAKFRNKHIGFVFQFHHLLQEFSALENVCIPGFLSETAKKEVENRAKELLDYLGLKDRIHHKPNQLSGGEAQRVAIARALINNPNIILADEPTGNLDKENSEILHQLLLKVRKDFNSTFVIVTHNDDLANLSDRVVHIVDGVVQ